MREDYEVVGLFYNPNIDTEEEYHRRLAAVQQLAAVWRVLVDTGPYEHERFLAAVRGVENEPEGGQRCALCFWLRLKATAAAEATNGCTAVASTLTIGPNKRAAIINHIGHAVCAQHGVEFVSADWKKQDGFRRSVELARELGLYRQHYCGCEFSHRRAREK